MKHSVHKLLRLSWKIVMAGLVLPFSALTKAEVTLDGTLGPAGSLAGPNFVIPDTVGQTMGPNLFHSFGLFNINTGESATFTGPSSIENVLGRVTGGSSSFIDGLLRTQFENASPNLFLLNPAGVLFGPNASLDVQGSFHVSTADYLKLGDGGRFEATNPENSVLTVAPPEAFGFLGGEQPASITFEGDLSKGGTELWVPDGETFSVIGGNIRMQYTLLGASAGAVNLVSVASGGEVKLGQAGLDASSFATWGEIKMQTSGITASGDRGGRIFIRGGQLVMQNATIWSDTWADSSGQPIDMALTDSLTMEGGEIYTTTSGTGWGGNIAISAPYLYLMKDLYLMKVAHIRTETQGAGRGGNLTVETGDILLEGHIPMKDEFRVGSGLVTVTKDSGRGGDIHLKTSRLQVRDGAAISSETYGPGQGGDLSVEADNILIEGHVKDSAGRKIIGNSGLFAIAFGNEPNEPGVRRSGDGGNIQVKTNQLTVRDGGKVSSDTLGAGNSGRIKVEADHIVLEDPDTVIQAASDFGWREGKPNEPERGLVYGGNAGEIEVKTKRLEIRDGAQISTHTLGPGQGGTIKVDADDILLEGRSEDGETLSGLFATGGGEGPNEAGRILSGDAGSIDVKAKQLKMKNGAAITANTDGPGKGGNVLVAADSIVLGSIDIKARDTIVLSGPETRISTSTQGSGAGGAIRIDATDIELSNGGTISAESSGIGLAGQIFIKALDNLRLVNGSQISVATTQADAGDITLEVGNLLHLSNGSIITTSAAGGTGKGGNITLNSVFVVLDEGSSIIANASEGQAGNILIRILGGGALFQSPDSLIRASNRFGIEGSVVIDAPDTDIIAGFAGLPANFLDAATVLTQLCAGRSGANVSSLVVRKYEVLPDSPYALRVQLPRTMPAPRTAKQSGAPRTYYAGNPLPPMISCLGNG